MDRGRADLEEPNRIDRADGGRADTEEPKRADGVDRGGAVIKEPDRLGTVAEDPDLGDTWAEGQRVV